MSIKIFRQLIRIFLYQYLEDESQRETNCARLGGKNHGIFIVVMPVLNILFQNPCKNKYQENHVRNDFYDYIEIYFGYRISMPIINHL